MEQTNNTNRRVIWIMGGVALLLYLVTMARSLSPLLSAPLLAAHLNYSPFPPLSNPVWGLFVKILATLTPAGATIFVLNLFSVVCAVVTVVLFGRFLYISAFYPAISGVQHKNDLNHARTIAVVFSSLILMVSIPFWLTATRAYSASFDLMLLLITLNLALGYCRKPRNGLLYALALLWGIGITEFATFILMTPVVWSAVFFYMWKNGAFKVRTVVLAFVFGLLGLMVYVLHAWFYTKTPAFEWREFSSFWKILWITWRDQYQTVRRSMGAVGWILVLLAMVMPWFIVQLLPMRQRKDMRFGTSTYFLYLVLTFVGVMLFFNVPPSPWAMMKVNPLMVTPYLFLAYWLGYLAGFWFIVSGGKSRFDPSNVKLTKKIVHPLCIPVFTVIVLAGAINNGPVINTRPGEKVHALAEQVLDDMGERSWLVTAGALDNNLQVAAGLRGKDLHLLNLRFTQYRPYLRYLASQFRDYRLKGLAEIGLDPLLDEWFQMGPEVADEVAVLSYPDKWFAGEFFPLADRSLFIGLPLGETTNDQLLFEEHRVFWEDVANQFAQPYDERNPEMQWYTWSREHLSKIANNLGVYLEELGQDAMAKESYTAARTIDEANMSALLNMLALADRTEAPEKDALQKEFDDYTSTLASQLNLWGLSYQNGYVRHPEAYASRGYAWAMSGKPGQAIREIRKAQQLSGSATAAPLLAGLYMQAGMADESRAEYLAVLKEDPDNLQALLGLARLAMQQSDFDSARGYLEQMATLGADEHVVLFEKVRINVLSGQQDVAIDLLKKMVDEEPDNYRAWSGLAVLAAEADDVAVVEEAVQRLENQRQYYPILASALAQIAMRREDYDKARSYLDAVLRINPHHVPTLEQLLRLDVRQGYRSRAETHVEMILSKESNNAFANYILGSLQYARGQDALAEESYRASIKKERAPMVLNDLAFLLQKRGALDESLSLIEESLALNERNPMAWDTYGVTLMGLGRYDEAEDALNKALALLPNYTPVLLNLALLYEKRGLADQALEMAVPLRDRIAEMDPSDVDQLRELIQRLRSQRNAMR